VWLYNFILNLENPGYATLFFSFMKVSGQASIFQLVVTLSRQPVLNNGFILVTSSSDRPSFSRFWLTRLHVRTSSSRSRSTPEMISLERGGFFLVRFLVLCSALRVSGSSGKRIIPASVLDIRTLGHFNYVQWTFELRPSCRCHLSPRK